MKYSPEHLPGGTEECYKKLIQDIHIVDQTLNLETHVKSLSNRESKFLCLVDRAS